MNKVALIGGTGTLAHAMLPKLLSNSQVDRVRILSRGEHRQIEMAAKFAGKPIDYCLGDVRDKDRVLRFLDGITHCYHLAAFKSIELAEYNCMEAIKTNIIGTANVIEACIENKVEKAMFTSTDKACAPINIYGGTKMVAERLFIQGNIGAHRTKFGTVRYGNVFGSNGSVIQKWKRGQKIITDMTMTRFFFSQDEAADFVIRGMREMHGGETFIPKMKSCFVGELYKDAFGEEPIENRGIRPGEKIHEDMISRHEMPLVTELDWCYVRWPSHDLYPTHKVGSPMTKFTDGLSSNYVQTFDDEERKALWATAV